MTLSEIYNSVATFVNPDSVKFGGNLAADFIPQDNQGHDWWNGAERQTHTVYGLTPETGWQLLAGEDGGYENPQRGDWMRESYSTNGHNEWRSRGETLLNFLRRTNSISQYALFLIFEREKPYGEDSETVETWTLYKSEDYAAQLRRLVNADMSRWAEYLGISQTGRGER